MDTRDYVTPTTLIDVVRVSEPALCTLMLSVRVFTPLRVLNRLVCRSAEKMLWPMKLLVFGGLNLCFFSYLEQTNSQYVLANK